jgi:hypothetical protein
VDEGRVHRSSLALSQKQKKNKKKMKRLTRKKDALSFVFLVLLISACFSMVCLVHGVDAEADVVGVKAGDWVKYSVTRVGSTGAWPADLSRAVWVKVEVLNVSGANVTIREIVHDADGSEMIRNSSYNLENYIGSSGNYIIAANLGPGDKIDFVPLEIDFYKWVNVYLTLNDTDYRSYGGVSREVNHLKFSGLQSDSLIGASEIFWINCTCERYWDKSTGFLLEWKVVKYYIGYEKYPSIFNLEIEDTNMWNMKRPQQLSWWVATIPVGAIIIALVAIKLRNNKKNDGGEEQRRKENSSWS